MGEADPIRRLVGGKYQLLRKLGHGAMGDVYEAVHVKTNARHAVKFLRPEVAANADIAARFHLEAQTAARLRHTNIVRVTDFDTEADGTLYLVQDFLDGEDLATHLAAHGPLPVAAARDLLLPVMSAVAAAHDGGVLHRDLKPGNIFLARDLSGAIVPTVIDFGIAKIMHGDGSEHRTQTGVAPGTLSYMSPEQLRCDRDLDGRSDVFALGVIWYRVLSGKLPFAAESEFQIVARILDDVPAPPITRHVPKLPRVIAKAVMRALEKPRERRFASMHEFIDAVLALDGRDPIPEPDTQPSQRARGLAPTRISRVQGATPPRAGFRSPRWLARGLAILVAALVAALVVITRPRPAGKGVDRPVVTTSSAGELPAAPVKSPPSPPPATAPPQKLPPAVAAPRGRVRATGGDKSHPRAPAAASPVDPDKAALKTLGK